MKIIGALAALLAFGAVASAQTPVGPPKAKKDQSEQIKGDGQPGKAEQLAPGFRIYEPKNISPTRAASVAKFVGSVTNITVYWDDAPRAIVIRGGNQQEQDAAEALLKRFDVPDEGAMRQAQKVREQTQVPDVTIYLIRALRPAPGVTGHPPVTPIPSELQPAIDEMKQNFDYTGYNMWDSLAIQPNGPGEMQGILPMDFGGPYVYNVSWAGGAELPQAKEVQLRDFRFSVKFGDNGIDNYIKTYVTIHDGQKLVLGKIRLMPKGEPDLFVVLTTKPH